VHVLLFSFGIVLWEILTRKEPFEEFETFEEFRNAVCYHHVRPPIPPNSLPRLAALIEACWTADPTRRPSFDQIIAQLDHIIVECAVQDEVGRKFWKRYFLKKVH
jgi:serine/threonine protein kinase